MPFNAGANNGGLPPFSISGIQSFGSHANNPALEGENIPQLLDNVARTFGNHSLKFGGELLPIRWYSTSDGAARGAYGYNGQFTGVTGQNNTGNGVADFIARGTSRERHCPARTICRRHVSATVYANTTRWATRQPIFRTTGR